MMKGFIFLITLIISQPCFSQKKTNSIIDKIHFGQKKQNVIEVLGVSEEVCNLTSNRVKYESSFKDTLEGVYYLKAREDSIIKEYQQKCYLNTDLGLKILFNNEMQVTRIFILDRRYKTEKGIRVGHYKRKVIKEYGKEFKYFTYIKDKFQYPASGIKYPEKGLIFFFDSKKGKKILEIGMSPAGITVVN